MIPSTPIQKKITDIAQQYLNETQTPGLSLAVKIDNKNVEVQSFGLADILHNLPVTAHTRFRIGSISKSITAVCVAKLFQEGRLDLDVPVQTYVPFFPEKTYPITTRQLLGHLSGLPHYQDADFVNLVHYASVTEALGKFKDRTLLFKPGEQYNYSSFGYNLVGAVVEMVAGMPYLEYVEKSVLKPLGMASTEADYMHVIVPHRTVFYEVTDDNQVRFAPHTDNSDVWPAGGFLSTPADLITFARGLFEGQVLRPETLSLMLEPMRTNDGEVTGYGMGWTITTLAGHRLIRHDGGHF